MQEWLRLVTGNFFSEVYSRASQWATQSTSQWVEVHTETKPGTLDPPRSAIMVLVDFNVPPK